MKAYVFDPLWPTLLTENHTRLLEQGGVEVNLTIDIKPISDNVDLFSGDHERILCLNPDYVSWSLKSSQYSTIPKLSAIITASTSFGWIEDNHTVTIVNIRNFSTVAVAEWSIMMMLNLARRTPLLLKNNCPLNFGSDFETYQGVNLKGKKVGVIGLGNIGSAIADLCEGLGMEVSYWSKSIKKTKYLATDLSQLFKESDFIFPTMADNSETSSILTDDLLKSMKQSAIFVSIVHKYYNHALILELVAEYKLFGYGFEDEKTGEFNNYQGNIWAMPAYAWCTIGSLNKSMDLFVEAIINASNFKYPNRVN
jgi:lactate dehydrogenase-like 2-hydroxyacid dehydrogenase